MKIVTRSNVNWAKHKYEVYKDTYARFGGKKAKKLMDLYAGRYNKYNRSFIDYRLARWVMEDYVHVVRKKGTRFYAFVGTGGQGKSTLMQNLFFWLDPHFNARMCPNNIDKFVNILDKLPEVGAIRAAGLDEPDNEDHFSSKKGRKLASIFGKMRQQQMWIGICATDVKDIPLTVFRKLDVIFFLPKRGDGYAFRNRPTKKSYLIQDIRKDYAKRGYNVFFHLAKKSKGRRVPGFLRFNPHAGTPFTEQDNYEYLRDKREDYKRELQEFKNLQSVRTPKKVDNTKNKLNKLIEKWHKDGKTHQWISEQLGVTRPRVTQILKEIVKVSARVD